MIILPAIDLFMGEAVRLYKGDYNQKTVYNSDPLAVAEDFAKCGAGYIHLVDLQGAKDGGTPNFELICRIKKERGLFCEVGGGIRSIETIEKYLDAGIDRVILGTAAVESEGFAEKAGKFFGEKIAVGVDIRDGRVSVRGWTEEKGDAMNFCAHMQDIGIKTIICTDISKDGAMRGTNLELYKNLSERFSVNLIASGGVSSLEDIIKLKEMGIYGAIIGKAYYTGAVDLKKAIELAG